MDRTGSLIASALMVCAASSASSACVAAQTPPGMAIHSPREHPGHSELVELARLESPGELRPLLVVYPRSACSGSASTVLVDGDGRFLAAIPPGAAALVSIPLSTMWITAVSSVEVSAPAGATAYSNLVLVPPLPSGLLLQSTRFSTRECGGGQYAEVTTASQDMLVDAIAEAEIQWLEPRGAEGQAWLDAHHDRVVELLGGRHPSMRSSR